MATIVPTQTFPINGNNKFMLVTWANMQNGDVGDPFVLSQYADRSVQIVGTFGTGGSVVLEGSNTGGIFTTLTDNIGNTLSFVTPSFRQVMEIAVAIQPRVTAGDVNTSITVAMLVRQN